MAEASGLAAQSPGAPLVALDTMVVIRGIVGRRDGADSQVLRAVATGDVRPAISDEGLLELQRVMSYDFVREKIADPGRALAVGLDIGVMGSLYYPQRHDWPTLPDRKDYWVLDLALASRADYVVTRDRHFLDRVDELEALGFRVLDPPELLDLISPKA